MKHNQSKYIESDELLEKLLLSLQEAQNVVRQITSADMAKGYILVKPSRAQNLTGQRQTRKQGRPKKTSSGLMYDDFHPFKPAQFRHRSLDHVS